MRLGKRLVLNGFGFLGLLAALPALASSPPFTRCTAQASVSFGCAYDCDPLSIITVSFPTAELDRVESGAAPTQEVAFLIGVSDGGTLGYWGALKQDSQRTIETAENPYTVSFHDSSSADDSQRWATKLEIARAEETRASQVSAKLTVRVFDRLTGQWKPGAQQTVALTCKIDR